MARRPDAIRNAQFWAEDGKVFFAEQLTLGFWPALRKGCTGFPYLAHRVIAALAAQLPILRVPLAYNASAIAITALTMAMFSAPGFRHLVRSDRLRAAICIAIVCTPAGEELMATLTNVGWFLAIWLVFLSLMRTPRSPAGVAGWALGAAAAVFSTPMAPVAAPLWALRALRGLRQRRAPDVVFAATATAALLAVIGVSGTLGANFAPLPGDSWGSDLWWTLRALGWVVAAQVAGSLLPPSVFAELEGHGALPVVALAVAVAAGVVVASRTLPQRGRVTLCLGIYLLVSSLCLTLAGRHLLVVLLRLPPYLLPHPSVGQLALPNVGILLAVAAIIDGEGRVRVVAAFVACLGLTAAWAPQFRVRPFPDMQWPLWAARLEEKLDSGSREPLVIPSHPHPLFDIYVAPPTSTPGDS